MLDKGNGQSLPTPAGTERKSECLSEKLELLKAGDGGWWCGRFALQGLSPKELRVTLPLLPLVFLEGAGIVAITITGGVRSGFVW